MAKLTDQQIADLPPYLQKLAKASPEHLATLGYTEEDVDNAVRAHHLDKDYTQAKQRLSAFEKHLGADADPEEVGRVNGWWRQHGEEVNELWGKRQQLREQPARQEPRPAPNGDGKRRKYTEFEYQDAYDVERARAMTASLREAFEDVRATAVEGAQRHYTEKIVPEINGMAGVYFSRALDMVDAYRQGGLEDVSPHELMNEAMAQGLKPGQDGRLNFRKLGTELQERRKADRQPIEQSAFERGREAALKEVAAGQGPSGPSGASVPTWRRPPEGDQPKTREQLRERVLADVEKKHGTRLPV